MGGEGGDAKITELRGAVDAMFHELVQTYVEREKLSNEELRRARESALTTLKKNRRLYQARVGFRFRCWCIDAGYAS